MEPQQLYEQQEKIGSGAFGEVYRVKHVLTGETFAIKKLRLHDDGKLQVIPAAQFQEIEALRQLEHPNVCVCERESGYIADSREILSCSKERIFDPKLTFLALWQIIKLLDVFPDGAYLSLVFEHMETDLFSVSTYTMRTVFILHQCTHSPPCLPSRRSFAIGKKVLKMPTSAVCCGCCSTRSRTVTPSPFSTAYLSLSLSLCIIYDFQSCFANN